MANPSLIRPATEASKSAGRSREEAFSQDEPYFWKFQSPLVKITLGDDAAPFYIHRDILIDKSDYFKSSLTCGMQESRKLKIDLYDLTGDFCEAFGYFAQYVYHQGYDIPDAISYDDRIPACEEEEEELSERCYRQLMMHAKVNILAERFLCEELMEFTVGCVEHIFSVARRYISLTALNDTVELDDGGSVFTYGPEMRGWADTQDYGEYRRFCFFGYDRAKDAGTGHMPSTSTILRGEDMAELLKLVYENTPEGSTLRASLMWFVSRVLGEVKSCKEFQDAVRENTDMFNELLGLFVRARRVNSIFVYLDRRQVDSRKGTFLSEQ